VATALGLFGADGLKAQHDDAYPRTPARTVSMDGLSVLDAPVSISAAARATPREAQAEDRPVRLPPVEDPAADYEAPPAPHLPLLPETATTDEDASALLAPYRRRAAEYPQREPAVDLRGVPRQLPPDFQPWWNRHITAPVRADSRRLGVNVHNLVLGALQHSSRVQSVRFDAQSRQSGVVEELAQFDWQAFIESQYDYTSDPVGNELTTGGPPRYRDRNWTGDFGYRTKTRSGGELEIAQELGHQENNSTFFVPPRQGNARFEISFTQPLLNEAGRAYNDSRIVLAQIDANSARDELQQQLQDQLLKVNDAYWQMYRARAMRLQKRKLFDSAVKISSTLKARKKVDALKRQVLRAEAAVASRRSEIIRAEMVVRNAESKLRLLVNDPELINGGRIELVPQEVPVPVHVPVSMSASLQTALRNRPDVSQAIREIRSAGMRLGVAQNGMLPRLDLILSTYVAGLAGQRDIGQAFGNQIREGEPGYSVGLLFEVPLGNRAARAALERRQAQMQKAMFDFQDTVESGLTEVEVAVREVETAYQEMLSEYRAMVAADDEAGYLYERWRLVPGHDAATPDLLEDLLDAQERLADEEANFTAAQVNHVLALARLKPATGTLLRFTDEGRHQDGIPLHAPEEADGPTRNGSVMFSRGGRPSTMPVR